MGMPRILRKFAVFNDGLAYLGEVSEIALPKLTRKMEDWRGGGMDRPVSIDMGGEALEMELTFGGPMRDVLKQYGSSTIDGVYMRFVGAYQAQDSALKTAVEIVVRGRYQEIDFGNAKVGDKSDFKAKMKLAYYKLNWNGSTLIEIDPLNMIEMVDGTDVLSDFRSLLGF